MLYPIALFAMLVILATGLIDMHAEDRSVAPPFVGAPVFQVLPDKPNAIDVRATTGAPEQIAKRMAFACDDDGYCSVDLHVLIR
jgi:hypothetical protein